jgi:hypothetical protein
MMNYRAQRWNVRLAALSIGATLSAVAATAGAIECSGGFGRFTCAEGTSVARVFGFLSRPVDEPAFYHLEIDMTGGEFAAVGIPVDENGNELNDLDKVVADKDPTPNQFLPVPYSDLFGSGAGTVDEVAEFQYPFNLGGLIVIVL